MEKKLGIGRRFVRISLFGRVGGEGRDRKKVYWDRGLGGEELEENLLG